MATPHQTKYDSSSSHSVKLIFQELLPPLRTLQAYIIFSVGPMFYLTLCRTPLFHCEPCLDFVWIFLLGAIVLIYFKFGRIVPRGVVFGTSLVGFLLHFGSTLILDAFSMLIILQTFCFVFLGLIYSGKLIKITRAVPLISIIEVEALYWLFSDRTHHEYNFNLRIQSELAVVILWFVASLQELQCSNVANVAEKVSRRQLFFLSRISHEIRTPLFGIIGIMDIFDGSSATEEQKQMLNTVKSCCETALNVVNEILDWSKSEDGKLIIQCKPIDLEQLIERTRSMVLPLMQQKRITFNYSKEDIVPSYIISDEQRLKQILVNLLVNATKFTDQGSIHLHVSLSGPSSLKETKSLSLEELKTSKKKVRRSFSFQETRHSKSHEYLRFDIIDSGVGITPDQIEKLFKPHSQLSESHAPIGTGLGLFICKKFVKAMGGSIHVYSEGFTKGTTFSFSIPLHRCTQVYPPSSSTNNSNPSIFLSHHILIVEDNPINQMVLKRQLSHLGCTYEIANNGSNALQLLQQNPERFSVILMDIEMPILDGITTTKEIRQTLKLTQVPIVALTAHALPEHQELAIACGMQSLLIKPFREEELKSTLMKVLPS